MHRFQHSLWNGFSASNPPAGDVDVNELRELTFIGHIVTFTSGRYKRAGVDDENIRIPGLFVLPSEMTLLVFTSVS